MPQQLVVVSHVYPHCSARMAAACKLYLQERRLASVHVESKKERLPQGHTVKNAPDHVPFEAAAAGVWVGGGPVEVRGQ